MHELSIAMSVVEMAQEEATRLGEVSVMAIHVRLGPLSGVVGEALVNAYELAIEGTPLANSRLVIEKVPVVVYCPNCREKRELVSIQCFTCAKCGAPTPDVVQGRELEVTALEVQECVSNP